MSHELAGKTLTIKWQKKGGSPSSSKYIFLKKPIGGGFTYEWWSQATKDKDCNSLELATMSFAKLIAKLTEH